MTTGVEEMMKRADSLYSVSKPAAHGGGLFYITPPTAAQPSELDEARALVLAFVREIPDVALTLAAMLVILTRNAWRWLRQWKRTPQSAKA